MSTLYTDIDPYCCEVLRARVADGGLPPGEVWERDIGTLTGKELAGYTQIHLFCGIGGIPLGLHRAGWPADWPIVTGGFPCQDVSVAGKGLGVEGGARSGLWKEMHRVIRIARPVWILAENVPALRTRGADRVLGDMEGLGYTATPLVVGAEHAGAPHRRHRVWIVGKRVDVADCWMRDGRQHKQKRGQNQRTAADGAGEASRWIVANTEPERRGARSGEPGDQGRTRVGRDQSAGGVQLADATSGGLRADGSAREGRGHADKCRPLVHTTRAGLEGLGADAGQPQQRERRSAGTPMRWPAPPGPHQHPWEAPRLIESGVGIATDGVSRRLAGYRRRNGLKALGNAVVPQTVELIARAMIASHENGESA